MSFTTLQAVDAHYDGIAALRRAVGARHAASADELRAQVKWFRQHAAKPHFQEVVALQGERVVGEFTVWQNPWRFQPRRFEAQVAVHPEVQGLGLGRQLAREAWAQLQAHGAQQVISGVYEDQRRGLNFLQQQGFAEQARYFDSVLYLVGWQEMSRPALPAGVRVLSLPEFEAEQGKEQAWRAFHTAFVEVQRDVPSDIPPTATLFEVFRQRPQQGGYLPNGVFLAVNLSGEVLAFTELLANEQDQTRLNTGLTGARRAYRGQQLALAVKLAALHYAKGRGAAVVHTGNSSRNAAMLALNAKLGFTQQRTWIELQKERP